MTDVERNSTARSGRGVRLSLGVLGLVWTVVTVAASVVVPSVHPAGADQLSDARAQAAALAAQIQADGQHLDVVSQEYDTAQQKVQGLDQQVVVARANLHQTRVKVGSDQVHLREQAVEAYMAGASAGSFATLFSPGGSKAQAAAEYQQVASGNLTTAIDALHSAERKMAAQEAVLEATRNQAQAALASVASARQAAQNAESQQQATLSQVKGQIATLVAQQEAAQAAAAQQAFEARVAAAQAAQAAQSAQTVTAGGGGGGSGGSSGAVAVQVSGAGSSIPPSGSGGAAAVAAAESQLGVPYVWGGETPGVGFDCSGLTQWSWGRAGVGIPRTAQEQYDAIAHVSFADLEPGDLIFWGYGTGDIYHVAMYIGGGQIIQAPETGETVSIAPIWGDPVGAGRP